MAQRTEVWRKFFMVGLIGALVLAGALAGCQPPEPEADPVEPADEGSVSLDGQVPQASYSLGYTIATNVSEQLAGELDSEAFLTGAKDGLGGEPRQVSEADAEAALAALAGRQQEAAARQAEANLAAGTQFLEDNADREGVVTTDSGLQYEVLSAGEGPKPGPTDTVTTHYHGTLIDGTVFDSSVERGEPASFPLNGVIPGWTEALQLMPVGSKWRLYVPADLAYGERGNRGIAPNSTLIFDVELLDIAGDSDG